MSRPVLPLLLGLAVLAGVGLAVWPEAPPHAGAPAVSPLTPVLSPRRVPSVLTTFIGSQRLTTALDAALGAAGGTSCLAVDGPGGVLYARNPTTPLIPASNFKLLTAAAALHRLGPDATFSTEVRGTIGPGGVVEGNLYLVGGGDPLLETRDYAASFTRQPQVFTPLDDLAKAVVAAGVREVEGAVVGDEHRFDTQRYIPTWKQKYIADNEAGPQSALTVNDNFSRWKPIVVAAANPPLNAAATFANALVAAGVKVGEGGAVGQAPAAAKAITHIASPPMRVVVGEMLRESDNLTAELIVKTLGGGTTAKGVGVLVSALADAGLPTAGIHTVDGSGLDRSDRATCGALLAVLEAAGTKSAIGDGLAVANRSGTLLDRFANSPAAAHIRAKTGSLDGVSAFSGFAESRAGPLTFSLLLNGLPRDDLGPATWRRLGEALVAYPDAPDPATIGPR